MHILLWYNLYIYKILILPCPKTNVNTTAVKYMLAIFNNKSCRQRVAIYFFLYKGNTDSGIPIMIKYFLTTKQSTFPII